MNDKPESVYDNERLVSNYDKKQMAPKKIEWYEVENTGWSDGISWFSSGGNKYNPLRLKTAEEAMDYIKQTRWADPSVMWRYVHVTFEREGNKEVTTKEWTQV